MAHSERATAHPTTPLLRIPVKSKSATEVINDLRLKLEKRSDRENTFRAMAALYDGKQFLVEKYAIANTPSLTLTNPTQLNNKELRVLAFGVTKPAIVDTADGQTFFEPSRQVSSQINSITTIIPGSKGLLDKNFTPERLKQELKKKETFRLK